MKRTILNMAGTQPLLAGAPAVKLCWDTEREDSLGAWSRSAPCDIVIPTTGCYLVTVCPAWTPQASGGVRATHLQRAPGGHEDAAVMLAAEHDESTYNGCHPYSWAGTAWAGDVLSVWGYQEGGSYGWGGSNRPPVSAGQSRNCELAIIQLGT